MGYGIPSARGYLSGGGASDTTDVGGGATGLVSSVAFGPGVDGDVVISVNTTLTRAMYYRSLTVAGGVVLTAHWPIFVSGTLLVTGTIANDAPGQTGGGNTLGTGIGGNGGNGAVGVGGTAPAVPLHAGGIPANVAKGGAGGLGSNGAGGPGGAQTIGTVMRAPLAYPGSFALASVISGGSGGGAGGGNGAQPGGVGGGGGGVILIAARELVVDGQIRALGFNGAAGAGLNAGGGGGGGGGVALVVCRSYIGALPVLTGGNGGAATGTGVAGSNGNTGYHQIQTA